MPNTVPITTGPHHFPDTLSKSKGRADRPPLRPRYGSYPSVTLSCTCIFLYQNIDANHLANGHL